MVLNSEIYKIFKRRVNFYRRSNPVETFLQIYEPFNFVKLENKNQI